MRDWHRTSHRVDEVSAVLEALMIGGVAIVMALIAAHGAVKLVAKAWEAVR